MQERAELLFCDMHGVPRFGDASAVEERNEKRALAITIEKRQVIDTFSSYSKVIRR